MDVHHEGSPTVRLNPALTQLRCSLSGRVQPLDENRPAARCRCCEPPAPLTAEYAPEALGEGFARLATSGQRTALGRYAFALPVEVPPEYAAGVGCTRAYREPRLSAELGVELYVKCESHNPSGSFKDRGLSVAVAWGRALGARRFCLPTQGNAGISAALFSARLALPPCRVWMPKNHAGSYYYYAARHFGAEITLFGDNIAAAGKAMREAYAAELARGELVDVSTFFEPGRLEGKKTLGLEIWEDFQGDPPDWIVYPTGGGTGLVGIAKAFSELASAGVDRTPFSTRLVAVQAEGCAPLVRAWEAGEQCVLPVVSKGTVADGLNVPSAIMGHEMLRVLRDSRGVALAVNEDEIARDFQRLGGIGVVSGYEGAATLSAVRRLKSRGDLAPGSRVLLLLTSGPDAALGSTAR